MSVTGISNQTTELSASLRLAMSGTPALDRPPRQSHSPPDSLLSGASRRCASGAGSQEIGRTVARAPRAARARKARRAPPCRAAVRCRCSCATTSSRQRRPHQQRARNQHAVARRAAGLLDPRRGVHGVADKRDLAFERRRSPPRPAARNAGSPETPARSRAGAWKSDAAASSASRHAKSARIARAFSWQVPSGQVAISVSPTERCTSPPNTATTSERRVKTSESNAWNEATEPSRRYPSSRPDR